jgi:hypothetical protein
VLGVVIVVIVRRDEAQPLDWLAWTICSLDWPAAR